MLETIKFEITLKNKSNRFDSNITFLQPLCGLKMIFGVISLWTVYILTRDKSKIWESRKTLYSLFENHCILQPFFKFQSLSWEKVAQEMKTLLKNKNLTFFSTCFALPHKMLLGPLCDTWTHIMKAWDES